MTQFQDAWSFLITTAAGSVPGRWPPAGWAASAAAGKHAFGATTAAGSATAPRRRGGRSVPASARPPPCAPWPPPAGAPSPPDAPQAAVNRHRKILAGEHIYIQEDKGRAAACLAWTAHHAAEIVVLIFQNVLLSGDVHLAGGRQMLVHLAENLPCDADSPVVGAAADAGGNSKRDRESTNYTKIYFIGNSKREH